MVTRADRRNTSAREHSLHPLRVDPTEDGVVNVDGPDAVDVALTPDAALETEVLMGQKQIYNKASDITALDKQKPALGTYRRAGLLLSRP